MPNRKKIIIAVFIVLLVVAALPFVGNKLAEDILAQRVELLNSYGVESTEATTESSYLETKKHYKFLIKDEEKFITYINQFSDAQLPPYINAMLKGVVIGVDAKYSNLPLSDGVSVDIYPLSLSHQMMNDLQKEDAKFYTYLENFLDSKGILYHINYNIVKSSFDGYIKDIKEQYIFDDNVEMKLNLLNATYSGKGTLLAPTSLVSQIQKIELSVAKDGETLLFNLKDFNSNSTFKTRSTYMSTASLGSFDLEAKNLGKDIVVDMKKLSMQLSSNTQGKYAEVHVENAVENLSISSDAFDINTTDFNYEVAFSEIDKDSLEELTQLLSTKNRQQLPQLAVELERVGAKLLSKGLKFEVIDLSLKNIALDKGQNLEGFRVKSTLLLKPDVDFAKKAKQAPMLIASSIDLNVNIKLSKKIFGLISQMTPMAFMAQTYAKEEGNSLVFDISFINGEFKVNGKALLK